MYEEVSEAIEKRALKEQLLVKLGSGSPDDFEEIIKHLGLIRSIAFNVCILRSSSE